MTKRTIEVEVDEHGAFAGAELKAQGVISYDQPLLATATARSAITYIDGENGILLYRGYPIEQLAEHKHFLEVAALLHDGELPADDSLREQVFAADVDVERIDAHVQSFPQGSHPMAILISGYAALGATHPETKAIKDDDMRARYFPLVLAETLHLGARAIARHAGARPGEASGETYARRFIGVCGDAVDTARGAEAIDVFGRALDVLFILHADHELNAGTNAMRAIGSADTDMYSSLSGAAAALYGPAHGGANEAAVRMLTEIGDVSNVPGFLEQVTNRERRLTGFGHRVYKNYDPRAKVIKTVVDEVLAIAGRDPLLDIAQELERRALAEEYFTSRKLYPNVDFYSGIAYKAMGFDPAAFTVLFAAARTVGWLSHYNELMSGDYQITRPTQVYVGHGHRDLP